MINLLIFAWMFSGAFPYFLLVRWIDNDSKPQEWEDPKYYGSLYFFGLVLSSIWGPVAGFAMLVHFLIFRTAKQRES